MKYIIPFLMTLVMAFALVVTGSFIKEGLIQIRSADRYVTVKGLAEIETKANLAIWPIKFKIADNDLEVARKRLDEQSNIVTTFLVENGLNKDEISVNSVVTNDALAQQYRQDNVTTRYAIDKTILVRTDNVNAVAAAAQKIGNLIDKGVLVGYGSMPQYSFTKLNDVKPQMIADATRNAREAAQQFANDSGATVGNIRSATQGYFSINARDDIGDSPDSAALYKKVRVVSTVEYYLND